MKPVAQIWLSQCQVIYTHQADQLEAECYWIKVAVWCNNSESFERSAKSRIAERGLTLLNTETPLPKDQWLAQHSDRLTSDANSEIRYLIDRVEQTHNHALGYLHAIPKEIEQTEAESYLHIETLHDIEPLDGQFDVHPMKTVPDALYEPLFGQPEPTEQEIEQYGSKDQIPPMKLYAILDAAKVKVPGLRNLLDTADLDFACLITGQDYEELKDSAPYIVELKEDNDFTRTLFTYNPKFPDEHLSVHLWHKEPGIYIRSRASLMEVGQHFAQFVRIQDEQGKWYFFRFWEPRHLVDTLQSFTSEQLCLFLNAKTISDVLSCTKHGCYVLRLFIEGLPKPEMKFLLTPKILKRLGESVEQNFFRSLKESAIKHIGYSDTLFQSTLNSLESFGFKSRKVIKNLMFWSLEEQYDILSKTWAAQELEKSRSMPDEIRFDRLKNLSRGMIKNG